jgi:hypothetical protein
MSRAPGDPEASGQPGGSPVPEWFGREDGARAPLARAGNPLGCLSLLFGLGIAAVAIFYGWAGDARAKKIMNDRDQCEQRLMNAQSSLNECRRQVLETQSTPCPTQPSATAVPTASENEASDIPDAGARSAEEIARVMRAQNPGFRLCYEKAVSENPNADAKVELLMTIDPSGNVSEAHATGPMGPTGLQPFTYRCFEAVAKGIHFPPAGEKTTLRYPLTFQRR